MPRGPRTLLGALAVAAALALVGCSSDDAHTDADVTFASAMLPHHEQAVEMVDMIGDRDVSPAFRELADGIRDAQQPEIDEMTGWLDGWGEPAPEAGSGMAMGEMDGMMSAAEMTSLDAAPDATFEQQWLTLMVEHHQGALTMARTEIADGEDPDAVALARRIVDTQTAEIDEMQALLEG